MRRTILIFAFLSSFYDYTMAQNRQILIGTPVVGWDSLKNLIVYPEIAKRAGVQAYVDVEVQIDSGGNAQEVKIIGHELFHRSIENTVKSVKWVSGSSVGRLSLTVTSFEIQFQLKRLVEMPKRRVLMIESDSPQFEPSH